MIRKSLVLATFAVPYWASVTQHEHYPLYFLISGVVLGFACKMRLWQQLPLAVLLAALLAGAAFVSGASFGGARGGILGAVPVLIGFLARFLIVLRLKLLETPVLANLLVGRPWNTRIDGQPMTPDIPQPRAAIAPRASTPLTIASFAAASQLLGFTASTGSSPIVIFESGLAVFCLLIVTGVEPLAKRLQQSTGSRTLPLASAFCVLTILLCVWALRL